MNVSEKYNKHNIIKVGSLLNIIKINESDIGNIKLLGKTLKVTEIRNCYETYETINDTCKVCKTRKHALYLVDKNDKKEICHVSCYYTLQTLNGITLNKNSIVKYEDENNGYS